MDNGPRKAKRNTTQTVWIRLSASTGELLRRLAEHNGLSADEQARLLVERGLRDPYAAEQPDVIID